MLDLYSLVEQSVVGLGVEVVDVERAGGGLLRVTIDRPEGVRIEDCEAVSRHLSRVFEVEQLDYARLEVGSPGTDRPLRRPADFQRFAGERAEIRLREPFEGRKVFRGVLLPLETDVAPDATTPFGLEIDAAQGAKQQGATQGESRVLNFTLDEVERARLDPVLDFKGKKR